MGSRTQVIIVGAGPAGLILAHLLHAAQVDCVVLERHSRAHVEQRIRAGVLEQTTVALLRQIGVADGLERDGLRHDGFSLVSDGEKFRIDLASLTDGSVTIYGQTEVVKDLIAAGLERNIPIVFEAAAVTLNDLTGARPSVNYEVDGEKRTVVCEFVAGCDGYHGISRGAVPADAFRVFERTYPFGWLGILADVPPCNEELIYSNHERGFALASMRSRVRSRYYLQCGADERLEEWPDGRIWDELALRLGDETAATITTGRSIEKSIAQLRSSVFEPMRYGRLFLAGDAAHIVPPTGAKGLNLAAGDVQVLADAMIDHFRQGSTTALDGYSQQALARVWKAERFSWWFTSLTHRFPNSDPFDQRLQSAELAYLRTSRAAQQTLAENYVGLPFNPAVAPL